MTEEKIVFYGPDELARVGIYHHNGGKALIIGVHGLFSWKGDAQGKQAMLAKNLQDVQIDLFRFDCTGCGESEGTFDRATLRQRIADLGYAVDELKRRKLLTNNRPLFLLGSSFGGPVILAYGGRNYEKLPLCGLITWASPGELYNFYRETKHELFKTLEAGHTVHVEQDGREFPISPAFLAALKSIDPIVEAAPLTDVPLLLIHGEQDETVPVTHAYYLERHYPGRVTKHIIEGASHRLLSHFSQVSALTMQWIEQKMTVEKRS